MDKIDVIVSAIEGKPFASDEYVPASLEMTFNNYPWIHQHLADFPDIQRALFRYGGPLETIVHQQFGSYLIPGVVVGCLASGKITLLELEQAITRFIQREEERAKAEPPRPTPAPQPKVKPPRDGFIYVIRAGEYFKIGKALNLDSRIKTHNTSNPEKVETVLTGKVADYDEVEADLHEIFMDKRHRGEWFQLVEHDLEFIKGYLEEHASEQGASQRTGGA